jgi:hypothetical protein
MAKTAKTAETEEHDHDHDGHDHDHDHDHDHEELSEEEQAQAEADVARMGDALAALDNDALRHGLDAMTEKARGELAGLLNLPRATMHLGEALTPLVRRKLRTASPDRQLQAAFLIVQEVNDETIAALGDRSEDPTKEDLDEVLPPVVEKHGAPLVAVMLAGYAASDAPCRPVMRELLDSDAQYAIGDAVDVEEPASAGMANMATVDKKALEAKRDQRRKAKDAKRAAELHEREVRAEAEAKRRAAVHESKRKAR